jgi:phosphatidylinositol dimannoside acyltransferase
VRDPSRQRWNRLALRVITGGVHALGPARRPLAAGIGAAWYLGLRPEARRRAARNHRRPAPEIDCRTARRRALVSYVEYVSMILDAIWADPLDSSQLRRLLRVSGLEHVGSAPHGTILAIAHFGNWDVAAGGALALGVPLTTVMAPIGPPFITELVMMSRRNKGLELFTPEQAARGLLRALQRGRNVAVMVDVPEAGPTVVVPYCGGPVVVSSVPARLAAARGVPIVPVSCWREGRGWRLHLDEPITARRGQEAAVMAEVAERLALHVRRVPEQWYPFHEVYADGG